MPSYTVPLQGGGAMTVNASDPGAAATNVIAQGGMPAGNGDIRQVGGTNTSAPSSTVNSNNSSAQLGSQINSLLGAIASGNKQAFDEAVRQFNLTFGLDEKKFDEAIRQFNIGVPITEANLTGMYQGNQTLAAQNQNAQLYGAYGTPTPGQSTLAAQQQQYAQQLGAINVAAALQANPFRQQQVLGQLGGLLGGRGVAGFQAPNVVPGVGTMGLGTSGAPGMTPEGPYQQAGAPVGAGNEQMTGGFQTAPGIRSGVQGGGTGGAYLQQMIQDIRDPAANTASMNSVLNAIPTPNKLNSTEFLRAAPSTQNMVLQGMQERFGLDPADSLQQIRNTLPAFKAPTTFGQVRR